MSNKKTLILYTLSHRHYPFSYFQLSYSYTILWVSILILCDPWILFVLSPKVIFCCVKLLWSSSYPFLYLKCKTHHYNRMKSWSYDNEQTGPPFLLLIYSITVDPWTMLPYKLIVHRLYTVPLYLWLHIQVFNKTQME